MFPTSHHSTNYQDTTTDHKDTLKNKEYSSTVQLSPATINLSKPTSSYQRISKIQKIPDIDYLNTSKFYKSEQLLEILLEI